MIQWSFDVLRVAATLTRLVHAIKVVRGAKTHQTNHRRFFEDSRGALRHKFCLWFYVINEVRSLGGSRMKFFILIALYNTQFFVVQVFC